MKFGFSGAQHLPPLSRPRAAEVLQCSSAPNSSSCLRLRRWEEGHWAPWGMLRDSYLDYCTKRRVRLKSRHELPTRPSSPLGYSEVSGGPLWGLWGETHAGGKSQPPRHWTARGRSPHTATERPQPQLHLKPLQSRLPVEEVWILRIYLFYTEPHVSTAQLVNSISEYSVVISLWHSLQMLSFVLSWCLTLSSIMAIMSPTVFRSSSSPI